MKTLLHSESLSKSDNLLPLLVTVIIWGCLFWFGNHAHIYFVIGGLISWMAILFIFRGISNYRVYEDRIEINALLGGPPKDIIDLRDIEQVRYEDEFNSSFGALWSNYLLVYPKKGLQFKGQKNDRLHLFVSGFNRKKHIIKLLKHFQSRNIEVVILTNNKQLKRETGLRNWNS